MKGKSPREEVVAQHILGVVGGSSRQQWPLTSHSLESPLFTQFQTSELKMEKGN